MDYFTARHWLSIMITLNPTKQVAQGQTLQIAQYNLSVSPYTCCDLFKTTNLACLGSQYGGEMISPMASLVFRMSQSITEALRPLTNFFLDNNMFWKFLIKQLNMYIENKKYSGIVPNIFVQIKKQMVE